MSTNVTITTPLTEMLGIKHPIILAGMNVAAGPRLAAAVTNAGGLGVIGGVGYSPKVLRERITQLKTDLKNKNAPFGVDLLLPQVGGSARKTNHDYTHGSLSQLVDVIIEEKASLFVSAVGVPPKYVVDRLHAAGIPVMNMIGAPKHVRKAVAAGVDILCCQGGEGGGHTGDVPTSVLVPTVVDLVQGTKAPLTGQQMLVVGAGGIFDGRGLAMVMSLGAVGAWVGTRFVASTEAGAGPRHKKGVVNAGYHDTIRTIIFTGRPLRILQTPYVLDWENNRQEDIKRLASQGIVPAGWMGERDFKEKKAQGLPEPDMQTRLQAMPLLMGSVAGAIKEVLPAAEIIKEMVEGAATALRRNTVMISSAL